MIKNNNTPDVAYLGRFITKAFKNNLLSSNRISPNKFPTMDLTNEAKYTAVFDCSGTRYGFRIKELKIK